MDRQHTLVIATLALAAHGLGCSGEGSPMLLDTICASDYSPSTGSATEACTLDGDARITTGVSADSTAVLFGPAGGTLRIRINAIPAAQYGQSWSLDAFAASSRAEGSTLTRALTWGSCGADCPEDPADTTAALTEDFVWASVVESIIGNTFNFPPDDAILILQGNDIHLLDVRTPGYDDNQYYY